MRGKREPNLNKGVANSNFLLDARKSRIIFGSRVSQRHFIFVTPKQRKMLRKCLLIFS